MLIMLFIIFVTFLTNLALTDLIFKIDFNKFINLSVFKTVLMNNI